MVKLTVDMIVKKPSGASKKKKGESTDNFLAQLTHLNLENRNLDETGSEFTRCPNLISLYLYDNKLSNIPDLGSLTHLSSLYLQNNNLTRVDNLGLLINLKKLYLGGNSIYVIEGLDQLSNLEELYVENQNLLPGESLIFDSQSILAISSSIKILNVSGNNLLSLQPFEPCKLLEKLNSSNNKLSNMDETAGIIKRCWPHILKLDFSKNPIACQNKYRDKIILAALNTIETLDGKEIPTISKQFLKGMQDHNDASHPKYQEGSEPQESQEKNKDPKLEPHVLMGGHSASCLPMKDTRSPFKSPAIVSCPPQCRSAKKSSAKIQRQSKSKRLTVNIVAPPSSSVDFRDDHNQLMNG